VFGTLSDKIGRKPIIMAGCLLAALTYFPLFKALTEAANPDLAAAQASQQGRRDGRPGRVLVPVQPDRHREVHQFLRHRQAGAGQRSVSYDNAWPAGTPPRSRSATR
jgi:hypothetical protein